MPTREEIQIQQIDHDIKVFQARLDELPKSKINTSERRDYYRDMIRELEIKRRYYERRLSNDQRTA